MKNKLKNSFFKEKLYISLNSSICKNPSLNIKKFHPINAFYSPINHTENNNDKYKKDLESILKERKNGSYKISSKRNFRTIIFQNWNTKKNIPKEVGNCLNFPVIMDMKKLNKKSSDNIDIISNMKYEYYYPVSNRKDLTLPSELKKQKNKRHKNYNSYDRGWKLITNYFYQNKKERELQKKQLLKMKLTAQNLSIHPNKGEDAKEEKETEKDNKKKQSSQSISNLDINDKKDTQKNAGVKYRSEKLSREGTVRKKSKMSMKPLDLDKVEEKKREFIKNKNINMSKASSSISDTNKKYSEICKSETTKIIQNDNTLKEPNDHAVTSNEKNIVAQGEENEEASLDLDKTIDWETFEEYKDLEENQFLYAIKKGKPLSYYLIDFKELKKINEKETNEKYNKHKLKKHQNFTAKHPEEVLIINYMTISNESVIIYVNGKPESYNINEFKSLYMNYKSLITIPLFKYWNKSKIFKLWLKYVQRQRRKKYEKKLKERLHILDRPVFNGIKYIKKILGDLTSINIFRLNSKEPKFPNQFMLDYHYEIIMINKDFEFIRSKVKEVIKSMCDKEVQHFMKTKKITDMNDAIEENKMMAKIEEKRMEHYNIEHHDHDEKNNEHNMNEDANDNNDNKSNKESILNRDKSFNYNYKIMKHREILKNVNIPEDLYKSRETKDEQFRKQNDDFIKNETNFAQIATKRNFYCKLLKIIRLIDHFFNEAKKKAVCKSLAILNKKIEKYYDFYQNKFNIYPLLKLSILSIGDEVKYIPEFNNLEELFFEKFIQENIFNFVNKKNFVDPQEFPLYMTCYEEVFEKSFDQNASLLNRIKNDDEINDLINNIKTVFYKIGDELNNKVDELRVILSNYNKYSKIDFKEFEEKLTPKKIQEYLDYVYKEREKTLNLSKINNIGIFELNIEQLLELITNGPNIYLKKAKDIVPNVIKKKQTDLINLLNEYIKHLSKEVKHVEGFIKLKHAFEQCKHNKYKIDEIENEIGDYIDVMNNKKNRIPADQNFIENQSLLRVLKLQYEELFQKINNDIENNLNKYKDILINDIKDFDKELDKVSAQLNDDLINNYCNKFNDIFIELRGLQLKMDNLTEKKDSFLDEAYELELEDEITNIKKIDKIVNEFETKKEIWEKAKEFESLIKEIETKEVLKLDLINLSEKFNYCINLCEKSFEFLPNFNVPKKLMKKVFPYKRILDVVEVIQNPVIQNNETKFDELKSLLNLNNNELSKYVDIYSGNFNEKFTVEALKDLNITDVDKFIEFNKVANEEERLRIFIKDKYDEINMRRLKYKFQKNTHNIMNYIYINKNLEENEYEFVEENIMILRKESLNPCNWVILPKLTQLLNNYERFRQFMNLVDLYNSKIREIDGILLSQEFLKEYPSENKRIVNESQLRYLVKLLQDNKFLSKLFQENVFNKIFSCLNSLLDGIEKNIFAINKFIDKRRKETPQYYIMDNHEIMYLYNHKEDEVFLQRIIKRMYPWIKNIDLNYNIKYENKVQKIDNYSNDEYIKIKTIDEEDILLKNLKASKHLKEYIDIIYNELSKSMKEHFKAHKKNNEAIYKNKKNKKINEILKSLVNQAISNQFIQEIFICIYYSMMDNIERCLKSDETFDKLFELYNICKNDMVKFINEKINDDDKNNGINRRKLFCLLSLFNYFISVLEDIIHEDVQSPSDFSFVKYLNPKIESDTLMFYFLGNLFSVEYGFEYIGIIKNFLLLTNNERTLIELINAYEFFKKPLILNTNYIKVENTEVVENTPYTYDSISTIASFLGKNIIEYSCNKNTDVNIAKNLLCSYNKFGPWIRINNLYNLCSIYDFEIISNQIVEVYYQLKHSEDELITMKNGDKILINNDNFNIILDCKDYTNKHTKKILGNNYFDDYRLINYVQIDLEFFIQMNLINLGIKNYELIMNRILISLNYIYSKLYNNRTNFSNKLFIYNLFNLLSNRLIKNKKYHIQNIELIKSNDMNIRINNYNNKKEIYDINSLKSIKDYESQSFYEGMKNLIESLYKDTISSSIYNSILNILDDAFCIIKEEKKSKVKIDNKINGNENLNVDQTDIITEQINSLTSKYEISSKSNYYNKLYQLALNFDNYNSFIIFGPSLSGKTTLFHLLLSSIKKIKNTNEITTTVNNLPVYPGAIPELFDNFSYHRAFTFFNDNKMSRINDILIDLYENGNKSRLFENSNEKEDKKEIKDNASINSNDSENSEKLKEKSLSYKIINILSFLGEISNDWLQFLLNNNEFLVVKDKAIDKLFFETYYLKDLNQSLITSENVFYIYVSNENNNGLNWENIVHKYINSECVIYDSKNPLSIKLYIRGIFLKYCNILIDFVNNNINSVNNQYISQNFIVTNLINYFDSFLKIKCQATGTDNIYKKKIKKKLNDDEIIKKYVLYIFIFSFSWIIKNFINISFIAKIEQIVNDTFKADDLKTPILDYYVNPITKEFDQWSNLLENHDLLRQFIKIDNADVINSQMIEPLYREKVIILFIISNLINNNKSLYLNNLFFSKNTNILNNFINDNKYRTIYYDINPNTKPISITNYFDENFYNIHRNIYGDIFRKKINIFIDDVNTNSSLDYFFIQLLEKKCYFDNKNIDFKFLYNSSILFLGKKSSINNYPFNLSNFTKKLNILNCYINYTSFLTCIYKVHLENKFKDYYVNTFSVISSQYVHVLCKFFEEINENKENNNILFSLDDIEQIVLNILKVNSPYDSDNRNLFDKKMTRFYFYNISRLTYDKLYNNNDKNNLKQIMCSSYNKIFKKVKINVEDIFENNEFLNGKLTDYIFTHLDINNNGEINEEMLFEYKKKEFFKNFIEEKLKEFNKINNNNHEKELILNDDDYEYIQNILFFCENNVKNKKIIILLQGNKLFKELIFKFCAFLIGMKVIECHKEINSTANLHKIFEEIVLNNKKIIYYINEDILLNNENSIYYLNNILSIDKFFKEIDIKKYNQESKEKQKEIKIDIKKALDLLKNNLKIALDFKSFKVDKEISDYFGEKYSYLIDNCHIVYQSSWIKKDYKFYMEYYFNKYNTIKEIKSSSNYNILKQNIFEIFYNTYLFSCELINKVNNYNTDNIHMMNSFTDAINIFLNKYEIYYNVIKEKFSIYEYCNPGNKITNFIKRINKEIYDLGEKKKELEKQENDYKKQRQMLLVERQKFNKQITEYEKVINDYNIDFFKISDDIDNIVNPIIKDISNATKDCLSYNDISLNEIKHSYENSKLGKLIMISIYKLESDNNNEISKELWDMTKKYFNTKILKSFFEKKMFINNINDKTYIKTLENIIYNNEFKELVNNINNEKYSKSPYISIKKFSSYFTSCYNYYKNLDKINELNKQKDEIKKEIDSLKNLEKEEKNKINESKSKNMELENNLISVEKEKYAILSDIKCHNKLMTVTKNFLQNLDDIIPELIKKKKIYQNILSHFVSYHIFISLYYAFAPIFDEKNRFLLYKYIYNQLNKFSQNQIKELTFLELFYNFSNIIENEVETNNNNNKTKSNTNSLKIKNLILSLYKYFDINKLNVNDEKTFILENVIFIDFYENKSICLQNNRNPGLSNLVLIDMFKSYQKRIPQTNIKAVNNFGKPLKKLESNKNIIINIADNISNDIVLNDDNWIYHLVEINLNQYQIEKDLEHITKILNEGFNSRSKRLLIFFINNWNEDNIHYFNELINNNDSKKRSLTFNLGKNKISLNNQINYRLFFSSKHIDNQLVMNPYICNTKVINFNVRSKSIKNELEFSLAKVSDIKYLDLFKENKLKTMRLFIEIEKINKKICEIINKYEYGTSENNFLYDEKLLTEVEATLKNLKNKTNKLDEFNKSLLAINDNLMHLNTICIQGGKIYKLIQKYNTSFSIKEFQILIEKYYVDSGFDELVKEKSNSNSALDSNNSSLYIESNDEDQRSFDSNENNLSKDGASTSIPPNNHVHQYSNNDLPALLNFLNENKIKNLLSSENIKIIHYLRISLYLYYLNQKITNDKSNKIYNDLYQNILSDLNELNSNSIDIKLNSISPTKYIMNENWNKLLYLSNNNMNIYSEIIEDISKNTSIWEKSLTSSYKDLYDQIRKILKQNETNIKIEIFNILIIISLICPLRFSEIKEFLMNELYHIDIYSIKNHYTLKGFISSANNLFNSSQKPLVIIEENSQNLDQKIQYIKNILYPKLLPTIKLSKTITSKISNKISSQNLNVLNNNGAFEGKLENSVKCIIIKDNVKNSNYDNIIQFVKAGGLIIIKNINKFDRYFISQIINLINDAKQNKYLDKTFRLIFTLSEPINNDDINEIIIKNCIYYNINLFNNIKEMNFKSKILENIKNLNNDIISFYSTNIYKKKILFNFIFLNNLLKEISENDFYFNFSEIDDALLFTKKYIEMNETDFKLNNNYLGNNYYFLIQIIFDNYFASKFTFNDDQSRIKNYIIKLLLDEDVLINENKYILFFNNGKISIENINEELNINKLFDLFNDIPDYKYNNIIIEMNQKVFEIKQINQINAFFKSVKYDDKQTLNTLSSSKSNIKYMTYQEVSSIFKDFIQKLPDDIVLPMEDEDINDENIYKNLLKREKNGMLINPLDEVLIEEVKYLNSEKNEYKNKLNILMETLNKKKFIKEEMVKKIIRENNIENNINYIINKYKFYKEWVKEGELKKYSLNYINNIKLLLYLLKFKSQKEEISLYHKKHNQKNDQNITADKILINYSPIKVDNCIEITGLSFNLAKKYELSVVENSLTLKKRKENNIKNEIDNKSFSLYLQFVKEEDNKNKNKDFVFNNKNEIIGKINHDLPLIKDQTYNNLDYDIKTFTSDLYQSKNNTLVQINDNKEKVNINISNDLTSEDLNEIILNGVYIYTSNFHLNINEVID